jgi:hypothetical protein
VGFGNGGAGTYNLSGGTLTNPERTQVGGNGDTIGIFNQTGGTHRSPIVRLTGETTASTAAGTYHLSGGTLETASVTGGDGTSTLNLNGGVLKVTANSLELIKGLTTVNVKAGGARFDMNGFFGFVRQSLRHDTTPARLRSMAA